MTTSKRRRRIKKTIEARAGDLLPCPLNPRTHPDKQRDVVSQLLDEFGWVDYFKAFEVTKSNASKVKITPTQWDELNARFNEQHGTKPLMLFDAHLRQDIAPDDVVDVAVTDLTVDEALRLIAAFDWSTGLADYDQDILTTLVESGNAYDSYNDENPQWLELMREWFEASKIAVGHWIVNVQLLAGNKRDLVTWVQERRDRLADLIIWDKTSAPPAMAKNVCNSQFELLIVLSIEEASRTIPFGDWRGTVPNVYAGPPQRQNFAAEVNAATMPVHLPEFIFGRLCPKAQTIIDPFAGTGTTMLVADQLSRRSFSIELSPVQSAVTLERMTDAGARCEKVE